MREFFRVTLKLVWRVFVLLLIIECARRWPLITMGVLVVLTVLMCIIALLAYVALRINNEQ